MEVFQQMDPRGALVAAAVAVGGDAAAAAAGAEYSLVQRVQQILKKILRF